MGDAVLPIASRKAVITHGLRRAIGHQRHVVHDWLGVRFFPKVHVEFLHVVPFHVKQESIAWRIGRLCEQGVLNPDQELGHALPPLVAFVGIL